MQISKQHLSGAKSPALVRLRLLDLNEHIGNGEDFVRGVDDTGTGPQVGLIGETGFGTRALFDHHLMAGTEQFVRARGYESYAVFVNLDLLRYADPHRASNLESALGGAQPVQIWILRMIRLDRVRRLLRGLEAEPRLGIARAPSRARTRSSWPTKLHLLCRPARSTAERRYFPHSRPRRSSVRAR